MNLQGKALSIEIRIDRKERSILDTATALMVQIDELSEISPIAAGKVFKGVIQYLQERNNTKTMFTVQELIDFGYLPS